MRKNRKRTATVWLRAPGSSESVALKSSVCPGRSLGPKCVRHPPSLNNPTLYSFSEIDIGTCRRLKKPRVIQICTVKTRLATVNYDNKLYSLLFFFLRPLLLLQNYISLQTRFVLSVIKEGNKLTTTRRDVFFSNN